MALFSAEALIWSLEGLFLRLVLPTRRAVILSLLMNGASFGLGWFLPL